MQKIYIAGTVGNVKELRDVGQNKVFSFSVSVSNGKNKDGSWKDSSWFDVSMWGARGESLSRIVSKGGKVTVSGRLQPVRVHEGKAYLSVDADDVTLQGGGDAGGQRDEPQRQQYDPEPDSSDIPF